MSLQAPNLDDRSFEQIVDELMRRIPRYTREWTDHNESDPGITLLQLFAWLTEMTLYRLNQVPERNYIKFMKLLGVELKPALPAQAELTFSLARDDIKEVLIPQGTRVAASNPEGGDPLVFETEETLVALGATLAAVQSYDAFAYSSQTTRNESAGQYFYPFGSNSREGSALVLGFDSSVELTSQPINLAVTLYEEDDTECHACSLDLEGVPPPATLQWEYWSGSFWKSLEVDKDDSRAFSRNGHIYLRSPGSAAGKSTLGVITDQELYWLRCRLVRSGYDRAPRLDAIITNTVRARQALTVTDEVLGGSDGRPEQTFFLANVPIVERDKAFELSTSDGRQVVVRSLLLEVNEGTSDEDFLPWQEVEDFYASRPEDAHFVLNRTTGQVSFGDGRHGRIPVANPDYPGSNVVAREYRFGGGRQGNVGAGSITQLQSYVEGVSQVTNLESASGGSDEETVDEAKLRLSSEIKAKDRAVTAEDFEGLAKATPGVSIRRAKAMPLCHPEFPGAAIPGVVTVAVVPDSDKTIPTPSLETLQAVCQHLNRHRLLTSEVYVVAPKFHKIVIKADVIALPEADLAEVKAAVESDLVTYFDPFTGGTAGQGWEFGRDIFYSQVYRVLLGADGVDRIRDGKLIIKIDDEAQEPCRDVPLESGALLYSDEHEIVVSYDLGEDS